MAFRDYIQHSQGISLADYVEQDGFRIAAGLHELVHRFAEIPDQDLRDHYARNIGFAAPRARPRSSGFPIVER